MVTILGVEKVDYMSKQDRHVEGLNLHCVSDPISTDRFTGQQVERIFVSVRSNAWVSIQKVKLGDRITVYYNRFGRVDNVLVEQPVSGK